MQLRGAIAGVAAAALLTACGGGDEGDDARTPAATPTSTSTSGPTADSTADPTADPTATAAPSPRTIVMQGYAFRPARVSVAPGETWTLDNRDDAVHNVQTTEADPVLASDGVRPGFTGTVTMPSAKGTYDARCFYHQEMRLEITVE